MRFKWGLVILVALLSLVIFFLIKYFDLFSMIVSTDMGDDIAAAESAATNLAELSVFFVDIAEEQGAVYAYELLQKITFPPHIDQHLMGHVVGDELYKQEGLSGMQYCTDDFRNACSHTIVIGALLEHGMKVFNEVNDVCHLAPGGTGAYTMCFHGFGHGVLAFAEYDMAKAVELCQKAGTREYFNQESNECIGGAVMEMKDGIHDEAVWSLQKDKYVNPENPLSICQADYMPEEAKERCYSYITPYLFDAGGADGGLPTPDIFADSMAFCDLEPNSQYRSLCYRGFGKEYVVLAVDYQISLLENANGDQLQKNLDWCNLADDDGGALECKKEVVNSLYWGGENDYAVSLRYCALWPEDIAQNCYETLYRNAKYYVHDEHYYGQLCSDSPLERQQLCYSMLDLE